MKENNLLIFAIDDFFLDKDTSWVKEYKTQILRARKINLWWAKMTFLVETNSQIYLSEFLRKLADLNYEKVQRVSKVGQFSVFGDTVTIYPILSQNIFQITFFGNFIENIKTIPPPKESDQSNTKKTLEKMIRQRFLDRLTTGDYVVHLDHGIGIFKKFVYKKSPFSSDKKKYFEISYAKNDTLFVPVDLSFKLSPYIGFSKPKIHRLGGSLWSATKNKVKKEVERLAKDLLALHARRAILKRKPYGPDDELQKNFEQEFPFELTFDQKQALLEIKQDLRKEEYMDRLLCGDVGFGKTEIAFVIAYKSILEGYQVAMLAPTMILAYQHFKVACDRFKNTGVKIEMLSRAIDKKRQSAILKDLIQGKIDFIIGTHRILSKDVVFKKLGLLIVDEEQKFGVKQKEQLRHYYHIKSSIENKSSQSNIVDIKSKPRNIIEQISNGVDFLSLSATPIPRTLQLALGGIWQISNIFTPPLGKKKIETFISPYNIEKIKEIIEFEFSRQGQIYYLCNHIAKLPFKKKELETLVPNIKIAILHAKMSEIEILNTLQDFEAKKYDLLLTTTIIENGLDLPLVNTLIVEQAEKLGLSQMHQIRGRIGRKEIQSYAYFFYNKNNMTFEAKKRLQYIKRFQQLGDGYFIALKDLEIRGAGNILGKEQSGYISAVGLNLYCHLLQEAVEQIKSTNAHY